MDEAALVRFAKARLEPVLGPSPGGWFFLAGGAFKTLLHGRPPRDLDLWPATAADRESLVSGLVQGGARLERDNPPYQTSYTHRNQVIEVAHDTSTTSLELCLARFDLALSAVGVEHREGAWRGVLHPLAAESTRRREVLLIQPLVNWKYALATLARLRRYAAELAFRVPPEEEQAVWSVFDAQSREEQAAMIARALRVAPGVGEIVAEARKRMGG